MNKFIIGFVASTIGLGVLALLLYLGVYIFLSYGVIAAIVYAVIMLGIVNGLQYMRKEDEND
jgi:uncharacterized metal-binding protein